MQLKKTVFHIANSTLMRRMNITEKQLKPIVVNQPKDLFISSNITLNLEIDNKNYYFRECKCHRNIREYVIESIQEYFHIIYKGDDSENIKKSILEDLDNPTNFNRFLSLPHVYNSNIIDMRNKSFDCVELIGLNSIKKQKWSNLVPFLKYCKGILEDYGKNKYLKKGMFHNFNSNRQISTRIVAELLNIENIVPGIRIVDIKLPDSGVFHGTLMEKAGDISPCKIPLYDRQKYNQEFIRQLTNMEYLDAICYQLDHRLGNYNVEISKEGIIVGVSAFDNDAPMTFFPIGYLPQRTYCGCSGVLNRRHIINRPYMDCNLYNKLWEINYNSLRNHLYKYLSSIQIIKLYQRIKLLRKSATKSLNRNLLYLVDEKGWTSIQNDMYLDDKYGMTYLKYFLTMDERAQVIQKLGEDMTNL